MDYNRWIIERWGMDQRALSSQQLAVAGLGLGGEAGETQEHIKKFLRDGRPLGRDFLLEAGDTLHYLTVVLNAAGFSLQEAMNANVEKLLAREAAGKPMRAQSDTMLGVQS